MGKNRQHLVPVKKIITRGGKTFETTVLVNPNKINTIKESNKKVNVPIDKWDSISSIDDFDRVRKEIFAHGDVSTKDVLKNEFVDYFVRKGIKFKRCNTNSGVDYMRCMMAVKKAINNGDFSNGKKKEQKYQEMTTEGAKMVIEEAKKMFGSELDNLIKNELKPQLTKTGNKGVDHMRCMMALREALEEGKDVSFLKTVERFRNPNYEEETVKEESKKEEKTKTNFDRLMNNDNLLKQQGKRVQGYIEEYKKNQKEIDELNSRMLTIIDKKMSDKADKLSQRNGELRYLINKANLKEEAQKKSKAKPKAEKKPKELNKKQRHAQWMKNDKEDYQEHLKNSDAQQRVKDDKDDYQDEIDEFNKDLDRAIKWDYDIDNIVFSFMKYEREDAYGEKVYEFDINVRYDIDDETEYKTLHTVYDFDRAAKMCRQLKAKYNNKFKGTTTGVYNGKEEFEVAAYNFVEGLDDPNDNNGKKVDTKSDNDVNKEQETKKAFEYKDEYDSHKFEHKNTEGKDNSSLMDEVLGKDNWWVNAKASQEAFRINNIASYEYNDKAKVWFFGMHRNDDYFVAQYIKSKGKYKIWHH